MIDEKKINEMMKDSRFFRLDVCAYLSIYLCILFSVVVVDVDVYVYVYDSDDIVVGV